MSGSVANTEPFAGARETRHAAGGESDSIGDRMDLPGRGIRGGLRWENAMRFPDVMRNASSIVSLLRRLRTVGETSDPAELIAISQGCRAIDPYQVTSELVELAKLVKDLDCQALLEIGTYKGGTLFVFARLAAASATVVSVDLPSSFRNRVAWLIRRPLLRRIVRRGQRLILIRRDSHRAATLARVEAELQGRKLDFLFIDGDHSYEGVKQDFAMYSPLVRAGGVVAFHDIAVDIPICRVQRFWEEIKVQYTHKEFKDATGSFRPGIGVLWV